MKIKLELEDQDVWYVQNALWIAAAHEVENMSYIKAGELEKKMASAEAFTGIINRYMQIHADVINQWAQAQDAETARGILETGIGSGKVVTDLYSRQLARIRGEVEKAVRRESRRAVEGKGWAAGSGKGGGDY